LKSGEHRGALGRAGEMVSGEMVGVNFERERERERGLL